MNSKSLCHLAMIVLLQAAPLVPQGIARADVVIVYDEANPEIFERRDAASEEAVTPGELYVASVYEGRIRTDGQLHGPLAKVVLDRPGVQTTLVLTSYEALMWEVTLTSSTPMPKVILSQTDKNSSRSAVTINGEPASVELRNLPYSTNDEGEKFRHLVSRLPEDFGVDRISDFKGAYQAPELPFTFGGRSQNTRLEADYLAALVQPDLVTEALRPLAFAREFPEPEVSFKGSGFSYGGPGGGKVEVTVSLDVPPISWPVAAVRDKTTGLVYGVSLGGEGFLYSWDPRDVRWRAISMENRDAGGLGFDSETQTLLVPMQFHGGRSGVKILRLNLKGAVVMQFDLPFEAFPGLTDIYDPGNGPAPQLRVLGIDGGKAILRSVTRFGREMPGKIEPWRNYIFDLQSGEAALVAYGNEAEQ
jgi:hypothetical protein